MPWYDHRATITKVVIEEGVISIGTCAFYEFPNVAEVVFPESLLAIGPSAFFSCAKITAVEIPENVLFIGNYAFRKIGAASGSGIVFKNTEGWCRGGEAVSPEFFENAKDVANDFHKINHEKDWNKVTENPVELYGGSCGKNNPLTWSLDSNGTITISGEGAMPDYLTKGAPWYGLNGAILKVVIEEGVTYVGKCSFYQAGNIMTLEFPNTLTTIGAHSFYYCRNLINITIPASVTTINEYAFRQCQLLETLDLGVKYGWSANGTPFTSTELSSTGAVPYFTKNYYLYVWTRDVNAEDDSDPNRLAAGVCGTDARWQLNVDGTLYVKGTGKMNDFQASGSNLPWFEYKDQITKVVVEEGITYIGKCAFYEFTNIKSVSLPEGLTSIGNSAFYKTTGIESFVVPASVTSIGTYAFRQMGAANGKLSITFADPTGWTCGGIAVDASIFADAITTGNALRGADYTGAWAR